VTRLRARLAGALAVPLVLTACGAVSSAGPGWRRTPPRRTPRSPARRIGVVVRFDDPDGDLVRALQEGPGRHARRARRGRRGQPAGPAVAATGGRTLGDQPEPRAPAGRAARWADSAFTLSTSRADLLSWRSVDGVLYVSSDLVEVERVAAAAGSPLSLQDEVAGAPAPLPQVHDALRAGRR
jgi:hypothetical protein